MAKRGSGSSSGSSRKTSPAPPTADGKPGAAEGSKLERLHVWQVQMVRDVLVVGAVVALFWAGYALCAVTVPLLVALLLAYLFEPLVVRLCRRPRITRTVAVSGLLAAASVAVVLVGLLAVPLIVGQTTQLVRDVRDGTARGRIATLDRYVPAGLRDDFDRFLEALPGGAVRARDGADAGAGETAPDAPGADAAPDAADAGSRLTEAEVRALVEQEFARLRGAPPETADGRTDWERVIRRARDSVAAIFGVLGAVVQVGLLLFLIPFYFFFFSLWYPEVVRFGRDLIPERNRARTVDLLARMDRVIAGFVRGRIVIALIMGLLLAVGWMICGVPYAIVLGLVVGVFCAVPYLGLVGIPLAVGLLFIERLGAPGNEGLWWLWIIVWPSVVFAIVQVIDGYVLTPMIAGKATNLDPVTILVAVLAGGSVLGVYGMLLAIPLAACGKILVIDVLLPKVRAWVRGEAEDPLPIDRE